MKSKRVQIKNRKINPLFPVASKEYYEKEFDDRVAKNEDFIEHTKEVAYLLDMHPDMVYDVIHDYLKIVWMKTRLPVYLNHLKIRIPACFDLLILRERQTTTLKNVQKKERKRRRETWIANKKNKK